MRLMFFSEHWKFNLDFKIAKKIPENIYGNLDNFI